MDTVASDNKTGRFVWRRNIKYDLALLIEVESKNPYAFNNQKLTWMDIAKSLHEGLLKMKVTDRSCRERTTELLKNHRKDELTNIGASGITEEEMSQLKVLLISVGKLEAEKPTKQLKSLYSGKDRAEAEAIRSQALREVLDQGFVNPVIREQALEEIEIREYDESVYAEENSKSLAESKEGDENDEKRKRKAGKSKSKGDEDDEFDKDFEFGPKVGKFGQPSNPKANLVKYLEKKNEKEVILRKEELRLREKELENKAKEVENQMKEMANKAVELDIMRMRAEAEIEDRKKITELLLKLATPRE